MVSSSSSSRVSWLGFLVVGAGALGAQDVRKLSGDLPTPPNQEVASSLAISPDGARVLYGFEVPVNTQRYQLRSVPIGGGVSEILSPNFTSFRIDSASERVLLLAPQTAGSAFTNLYSVPIDDGSQRVRLNATLGTGGLVFAFQTDPSEQRVVFSQRQTTSGPRELWVAPVDGSAPAVKLNASLGVTFFAGQSDWVGVSSTRAVFVYPLPQDLRGLASVPLDGSAAPTVLTGALFAWSDSVAANFPNVHISPDGSRVVYFGDTTGAEALYSVPVDGSTPPVKLSTTTPRAFRGYRFMPGGRRVVFVAGEDLCSVPIDGSRPPVVIDAAPQGWTTVDFQVDPSGERLAFERTFPGGIRELYGHRLPHGPAAREVGGDGLIAGYRDERHPLSAPGHVPQAFAFTADGAGVVYESGTSLYGVSSDGSAPAVLLSGDRVIAPDHLPFQISADGARVVFGTVDGSLFELYSAPLDGSTPPVRVHPDLAPFGDTLIEGEPNFAIDPSSQLVVYGADYLGSIRTQLFVSPIDGGAATQLSPELAPGPTVGDVEWFGLTSDGQHALYVSPEEAPGLRELFSAPLSSAAAALKLNEPLIGQVLQNTSSSGQHLHPVTTPDGSAVLYLVDGEHRQLFRSPANGVGPTILLAGATAPYPDGSLVLTSAGDRVVYRASPGLRSLPVDGSASPTTILATGESSIREYVVTADDTRLVYLKAGLIGDELFTVPMDGSQVVTRLSPSLVLAGTDITWWMLSPDETRAVFAVPVSAGPNGPRYDLYSAPTDGSSPAVKINGPVVANGGTLWGFLVSADSSRVVYRTDQDVLHKDELYSVPIDGSAPPIKLNHALPAGGDVDQLQVTPGGRVLYLANSTTSVRRLYSAPIDGSAAAVHLSGTFGPNGGVVDFLQHPDGLTVVYRAEQLPHDDWQFYRVPIAGGSAPVLLNDVAHPSWDGTQALPDPTTRFQLSPDGAWVVYHVLRAPSGYDLFAATTDGSLATIQLNPPTTAGSVWDFRVRADSAAVVYFADQDEFGTRELYQSALELPLVAEPRKVVAR